MRSREEFRALRETVGMSRAHLASILDVQERAVKRWETPNDGGYYIAPDDAWVVLDNARQAQFEILESWRYIGNTIEQFPIDEPITLPYYLTAQQFKDDYPDKDSRGMSMVNANMRLIAEKLHSQNIPCEFVEPSSAKVHFLI